MPLKQLSHRDYYTTGEMARALGCAQQTVIRRIDGGLIPAFRLPGRNRQRRCRKAEFHEYLANQGIPASMLDAFESRRALSEAFRSGGKRRG